VRNEKRATALVPLLRFDTEDFADALQDAAWIENAAGSFRKHQRGAGLTGTPYGQKNHRQCSGMAPLLENHITSSGCELCQATVQPGAMRSRT
jgi:hypothetical protein